MSSMSLAIRLIPLVAMTTLLLCVPYTKVEESFNMQATHDLLFLSEGGGGEGEGEAVASPSLVDFDHHVYPGVVPRTFAGPLYVAGLSHPVLAFLEATGLDASLADLVDVHGLHANAKLGPGRDAFLAQVVARWVLGATVCAAFDFLANGLVVATGKHMAAPLLSLMLGTQFHLMFYASRLLPNTFATVLVAISCGLLLRARFYQGLAVLGIAASVFRSDVLVLVAPLALLLLATKRIDFIAGLCSGVLAIVGALAVTVPIDSFFWRYPVWPEGAVFWFNTAENKSSEWGTSPWPWYFYSVVPKALFAFLPFFPFAFVLGSPRIVRTLCSAAILFLVLYSFLPHKELRFILMVFPILFCPIASWFAGIPGLNAKLVLLGCVLLNATFAVFLCTVSLDNYPGGVAISYVNQQIRQAPSATQVSVHIDAYAGMSGVTRFLKLRDLGPGAFPVAYSKDPSMFNSSGAGVYTKPLGAGGPQQNKGKRTAVKGSDGSVTAVAGLSASTIPEGSPIPQVPSGYYKQHNQGGFNYLVTRYTDKGWHLDQGYYSHLRDIQCFSKVDYRRQRIVKEPFLSIFVLKKETKEK